MPVWLGLKATVYFHNVSLFFSVSVKKFLNSIWKKVLNNNTNMCLQYLVRKTLKNSKTGNVCFLPWRYKFFNFLFFVSECASSQAWRIWPANADRIKQPKKSTFSLNVLTRNPHITTYHFITQYILLNSIPLHCKYAGPVFFWWYVLKNRLKFISVRDFDFFCIFRSFLFLIKL
jgi:hypothetical protein